YDAFFFSGRRRHTRWPRDWSSDVCSSDLPLPGALARGLALLPGAATQESLLGWSVAATVVLFILGWTLSVLTSYVNVGFGQGMRSEERRVGKEWRYKWAMRTESKNESPLT